MLRTFAWTVVLVATLLGRANFAAADTSWLPRWLGGKSDEVDSAKSKPSKSTKPKAAHAQKSSGLFTSTKDLFAPKKKKRIVSKYPADRVQVSHSKDDRPWYSRLFVPEEQGPPRSVGEWMELEQIKP